MFQPAAWLRDFPPGFVTQMFVKEGWKMRIKFVDLAAQNAEIQGDVERAMVQVHNNTAYIGGPNVTAFEEEFAAFVGVKRVVGVGSGTDALRLTLLALGIGAGDEVI